MKTSTSRMLRIMGFKLQGDLGPYTCYTSQRNAVVWFLKSPPKEPATQEQLDLREGFRTAARRWREIGQIERDKWRTAAIRANLRIGGYALFTRRQMNPDDAPIRTVERQTGLILTRP